MYNNGKLNNNNFTIPARKDTNKFTEHILKRVVGDKVVQKLHKKLSMNVLNPNLHGLGSG
jgi:hypothetical protein